MLKMRLSWHYLDFDTILSPLMKSGQMKTLFSSVSLRLFIAIALLHFASLQSVKADTTVTPEQMQFAQDPSNILFDQSFPGQAQLPGLSDSSIDAPMSPFEAVPTASVKANNTETHLSAAVAEDVKHLSITAIPEPSSWVLLSLGVGTLMAFVYILRQHGRTAQ